MKTAISLRPSSFKRARVGRPIYVGAYGHGVLNPRKASCKHSNGSGRGVIGVITEVGSNGVVWMEWRS